MSGPTKDFWDALGCGLFIFLVLFGVGACSLGMGAASRMAHPSETASDAR